MKSAMCIICTVVLSISSQANAKHPRSSAVKADFQRSNPCPSTGQRRGACPGWVKDHVTPLCAGGADSPDNLQWQSVQEAKIKDREERKMCRRNQARPARAF